MQCKVKYVTWIKVVVVYLGHMHYIIIYSYIIWMHFVVNNTWKTCRILTTGQVPHWLPTLGILVANFDQSWHQHCIQQKKRHKRIWCCLAKWSGDDFKKRRAYVLHHMWVYNSVYFRRNCRKWKCIIHIIRRPGTYNSVSSLEWPWLSFNKWCKTSRVDFCICIYGVKSRHKYVSSEIALYNSIYIFITLVRHNKSPVRQQNAWFDTKKPSSTQKCPVRHKNALPSMHQMTLPLSNIPRPSCEKYFFQFYSNILFLRTNREMKMELYWYEFKISIFDIIMKIEM